jgi:hypothetical protein
MMKTSYRYVILAAQLIGFTKDVLFDYDLDVEYVMSYSGSANSV